MGRLRAGRGRGGDGRRAGRLVRGDGAVPPPARDPDPAHGDHPPPQGPDRAQPRRVRRGQLPHPRRDRRAAARRRHRAPARRVAGPAGQRRRAPASAIADAAAGHHRGARRPRRPGRRSVASSSAACGRRTCSPLVGRAIDASVEGGHLQRLLDAVFDGPRGVPRRERADPAGAAQAGVAVVGAGADRRPRLQPDLRRRASTSSRTSPPSPITRCARPIEQRVRRPRRAAAHGPGADRQGARS